MSDDKKADKAEKKAGGGGNKLMLIVIILLILVLAAVGGLAAYMFTNMNKPAGAQAEQVQQKPKKKHEGPPIFEKMDTFVVNLAGNDGSLLQIDMQAELGDEEAKKKFADYAPKVRSAVILLLSSKTAAEVSTAEGKVKLKAQVKQIINEAMDAGEEPVVESVLFTSFIIQKQ
ncbi:flagellar basal body-associated FliL family protein [Chromobacterium violaceum]|uniref:Flagellar protein FliL n=2 Tax=Chromobacterium violaceum TaxID=536 RepID=A0AAX2M629_CHRVL|nr:flagellar basal body-associated FliL family protein [Chromobacterium violaceum]MBX9268912.1 flagellar basal body-associated FliL family protein [Chromobacterium violaceum]OLZ79025.1 flagellar basal body-associated protein FliL [Chromobacterium violaceum]SUX31736.1 flagellar basal body-associated protein FliL [Chromobacterium violaceum]